MEITANNLCVKLHVALNSFNCRLFIFFLIIKLLSWFSGKAAKAAGDICAMYGKKAIAESSTRDWYAKFKNENVDLNYAPRSDRPVEFDEDRLKLLWHGNSCQITR